MRTSNIEGPTPNCEVKKSLELLVFTSMFGVGPSMFDVRILFLIALTWLSSAVMAQTIHVSPAGNDLADGTAQHPLASLAQAQTLAREYRGSKAPTRILLHAGTYYLPKPLFFTDADSGTKEAPIIWQGSPGGTVVISGGAKLVHLKWTPFKDGILQTQVPDDIATDQLFINGQRQILARYPHFDPNVNIFNGYAADCISPERVAKWSDPAGVLVLDVQKDSRFAAAGLQKDDVILEADGKKTDTVRDLPAGVVKVLSVSRNQNVITIRP